MAAMAARGLVEKLSDAGVIPEFCQRVVIDLAYDKAMQVYYQVIGDDRWCEPEIVAELALAMKAAKEDTPDGG